MSNIENINWDFVVRSILSEKCILFVGPGLSINYNNPNNQADALKAITEKSKNDILSYHEKDGFLVFKDENAKLLSLGKIREFYQQNFVNPVLEKLAEIPFHLIINVTPDATLQDIFKKKNFAFSSNFYSTKMLRELSSPPKKATPLIYNLFGTVEDDESLIVSHYDLFNYLKASYSHNSMPVEIKNAFSKDFTNNIIFLGFDFDKWYYQLILNLLNLNFEPCIKYAFLQDNLDNDIKTLYESHFKLNFEAKHIEKFVTTLHEQFSAEQLRKPAEAGKTQKKYLKPNIIKFLNAAFNATDLDTLCLCYFEDVHNQFTAEQSKITRINMLIDYVSKNNAYDDLLEPAKEQNPVMFEKFAPYFE